MGVPAAANSSNSVRRSSSGKKPPQSNITRKPTLALECFADIEAKPVAWLWKERIPKAMLTIFAGDPDSGKTSVAVDVTARHTTGREYPDAPNTVEPGDVLIISAEDDPDRVLKPRLIAAEADVRRVHYLKSVRDQLKPSGERLLALDQDLHLLEETLKANPCIQVVILDTLSSYLGKADLNKEQKVRDVLLPLKDLCSRLSVTVIGIMHFNKRSDVRAIHKAGGAVAFAGVARAVWLFARNPKDEDEFLMLLGKGNLTGKRTGLKYRISVKQLPTGPATFIVWAGEATEKADEVLDAASNPLVRRQAKAERFLSEYLANGARKSEELLAAGKSDGLSRNALFEAKKALGIVAEKREGCWWWCPPEKKEEKERAFDALLP